MKKILGVVLVLGLMLVLSTGVASAAKTFVLSNPSSDGMNFELRYVGTGADVGTVWNTQSDAFYMVYDLPCNMAVTGNWVALGAMMDTSALVAPNGVQTSCMSFAPFNVPDGGLIATFTSDAPTSMYFDIDNALFAVVTSGLTETGRQVEDAGRLDPAEDAGNPGFSGPVPPIPEIITIVLVSMGLIALGGYIWYRRHKKAAMVAA